MFYRQTYYEVIDYALQAIRSRFDQDGYKTLQKLEELLCDSKANLDNFENILSLYAKDLNREHLSTQLCTVHSNLPEEIESERGGMKLRCIVKYLQSMSPAAIQFHSAVVLLANLILVMPATNAISERCYSSLRRIKTWLRKSMHQKRLNWCMVLHVHSEVTDQLDLTAVVNEFVERSYSRESLFGQFV